MTTSPSDLGPLGVHLNDPLVADVLVNGDGRVFVEREGSLLDTGRRLGRPEVELLIERAVMPLGRRVDRASPIVDARLPDGSRFHAVVPPVAVDGPVVSVRRFSVVPLALEAWCSPSVAELLRTVVRGGWNLLVSGGTGVGKTTLLNSLAGSLPPGARVVTVEDAAELRLDATHVVRLEARPANAEGAGEVTVRDLVRAALRQRPDRLVVGEVRGPEALDLLQAFNTGHAGAMATIHANSGADALRRLETLVLMADVGLPLPAIRAQVGRAIDVVVHVERHRSGRRIASVAEVHEGDDPSASVRLLADGSRVVAAPSRPMRIGEED